MDIYKLTAQNNDNSLPSEIPQILPYTRMYRGPFNTSALPGSFSTEFNRPTLTTLIGRLFDFFRPPINPNQSQLVESGSGIGSTIRDLLSHAAERIHSFFTINSQRVGPTELLRPPATEFFANSYSAIQQVAYRAGNPVTADLVVNNNILDRHGNPLVLDRNAMIGFEAALAQYSDMQVTSSFRTHEEQSELYQRYRNGTNQYPAARPGYSEHQSGFALDISRHYGDQEKIHAAMSAAGFFRPLPESDPVHWEFNTATHNDQNSL